MIKWSVKWIVMIWFYGGECSSKSLTLSGHPTSRTYVSCCWQPNDFLVSQYPDLSILTCTVTSCFDKWGDFLKMCLVVCVIRIIYNAQGISWRSEPWVFCTDISRIVGNVVLYADQSSIVGHPILTVLLSVLRHSFLFWLERSSKCNEDTDAQP